MFLQKLQRKTILSLAMFLIFAGYSFSDKKSPDIPWFFI